jgi:uncharacterized protein (TIGR02996 family)
MSEEEAFLDALRSKPDDDVTRLVYADWLDEQGGAASTAKSEFLRLQCQLAEMQDGKPFLKATKQLAKMATKLDTVWLRIVSRVPIENCELWFEFQCPKQWDKLQPTAEAGVRFCEVCQKNVHYSRTVNQARGHALQGRCVAVELGVPRSKGDLIEVRMLMGISVPPRLPEPDPELGD